MAVLTVQEVIDATGGKLLSGGPGSITGISIDSRTISDGDLFFALKGDRFDGHDYLEAALNKGIGAVAEQEPALLTENKVIITVDDTLKALQDVAYFIRTDRDIPVVAITGSNGKTTTKEMAHAVLSKKFRTLKNMGNLNNHIGLPLSLAGLGPDYETAVLEMGMNAPGEIKRLCEISSPTHGVITNIGSAHIGMLGSHDAVRDAKLEILEGLGTAIINADDDYLMEGIKASAFKGELITFAVKKKADVMADHIQITDGGSDFILSIKDKKSINVSLRVHGLFNIYNALAAAAAGFSLGIGINHIQEALEEFRAVPMRFEVIREKGITLINDSYNANPTSMEEAVKELVSLSAGGRTVALLGDMRELKEHSEELHREIGKMVSESGVDIFIAVGERMKAAKEEIAGSKGSKGKPEVYSFKDINETADSIADIIMEGDTVLLKGSRAIGMEKLAGGIINAL